MNDPFDVRLDEWMAMDLRDFYEPAAPHLARRALSRPDVWVRLGRLDMQQAQTLVDNFQGQPESEQTQVLAELLTGIMADYDSYAPRLQRNNEEARAILLRHLTATEYSAPREGTVIFRCGRLYRQA